VYLIIHFPRLQLELCDGPRPTERVAFETQNSPGDVLDRDEFEQSDFDAVVSVDGGALRARVVLGTRLFHVVIAVH